MRYTDFDIAVKASYAWMVNGEPADEETADHLDEESAVEREAGTVPTCPYCRRRLRVEQFDDMRDLDGDVRGNSRWYVLDLCVRCAFWRMEGFEGGNRCMDPTVNILASAVAAKFSATLPDGCSEALAQCLRRAPMDWHNLSPKGMELLVAEIFRANYRHSEVIHVGGPGDRGIDVVFVDADRTRHLIQVKRREQPRRAEGFSTLQSILGTLVLEGERNGIIVTTADSFSYQARRERERAAQRGYLVKFIDKGILDRMLGPLLPRMPWRALFEHPTLSHVDDEVRRHFLRPDIDGQSDLFEDI